MGNYGLVVAGFFSKKGVNILKQKLGDKKYQRVKNDCRTAVAALWDANKELGLDKIERMAVKNLIGTNKYKDLQLIEETVKKVIDSVASMEDNQEIAAEQQEQQTVQPTEQSSQNTQQQVIQQ